MRRRADGGWQSEALWLLPLALLLPSGAEATTPSCGGNVLNYSLTAYWLGFAPSLAVTFLLMHRSGVVLASRVVYGVLASRVASSIAAGILIPVALTVLGVWVPARVTGPDPLIQALLSDTGGPCARLLGAALTPFMYMPTWRTGSTYALLAHAASFFWISASLPVAVTLEKWVFRRLVHHDPVAVAKVGRASALTYLACPMAIVLLVIITL